MRKPDLYRDDENHLCAFMKPRIRGVTSGKQKHRLYRIRYNRSKQCPPLYITSQKRILTDYARKNNFTNIRHFTDDRIRGTTFKRPELDAMLEKIRAGNGATVIIKDQSRIGVT